MVSPVLLTTSAMLVLLLFFLTTVVTSATMEVTGMPRKSLYGEECNKTVKCDPRSWLGCYNGKCDCVKPDEMIYEEKSQKCLTKSGERCTFALDEMEDNINFIFEVTSCVSAAHCSIEGICVCDSRFYPDSNGTCTFASRHQENCTSQLQCSKYEALLCQDGLCECNRTNSIYSMSTAHLPQCVGLAGHPCVHFLCTEDATCTPHEINGNLCRCKPGFFQDENNKCVQKFGPLKNCTESVQCKILSGQPLMCLNGICNCNPLNSEYTSAQRSMKASSGAYSSSRYDGRWLYYADTVDLFHEFNGPFYTQCVGLADSPCIDGLCTPNGFCSYSRRDVKDLSGTCQCIPGYTKSKSMTCGKNNGENCTAFGCINGLACVDSKCACPFESQRYNDVKESCVSRVGGPCQSGVPCDNNAECSSGHCKCQAGYIVNADGVCKREIEKSCSVTSDCDTVAALKCIDGTCLCGKFAQYNAVLRKCVGLAGSQCNLPGKSKYEEEECAENSFCALIHPKLPGRCTCSRGFQETSSYTCVPLLADISAAEIQ